VTKSTLTVLPLEDLVLSTWFLHQVDSLKLVLLHHSQMYMLCVCTVSGNAPIRIIVLLIQSSDLNLQHKFNLSACIFLFNYSKFHHTFEPLRIPYMYNNCSCNQGMIIFFIILSYFKIAVFYNLCKVRFSRWEACCVW